MKSSKGICKMIGVMMMVIISLFGSSDVIIAEEIESYPSQKILVAKPSKIKKQDIKDKNFCVMYCGEKIQLIVNGKKATNWKSSNSKYIKVNSKGVVTACEYKWKDVPYADETRNALISCKQNGVTYKCYITNGNVCLTPKTHYYKGEEKKVEEAVFGSPWLRDGELKGIQFYDKNDKDLMEYYNGDSDSISFTEDLAKKSKWKSTSKSIVKVQWDYKNQYKLILGKTGKATISTSFMSAAGYKYKLSKEIYVLDKTVRETQKDLLDHAEEYFVKWKAAHKISYTEDEVRQQLTDILKKYPDGENYKDSKYYDKEWIFYDDDGKVEDYSPSHFSYVFASKINCELFGTDQCIIDQIATDEYKYITVKKDYRNLLFIGDVATEDRNNEFYPYFAKGCANGCDGFAKGVKHYKNDYDKVRIGDIIITNLCDAKSRAAIVISKTSAGIDVIYSDKTTHYTNWSREKLEDMDFMIITRYE